MKRFVPQAILFDAYGTLFDVYSVGQRAEVLFPGQGVALARAWRDKQVEYTRLRSMARQYRPFWEITQDALRFCAKALGLNLTPQAQEDLMQTYAQLDAFAENIAVLGQLKERGIPLAIHTNGNPDMVAMAVRSAGMTGLFDVVLSADQVKKYKVDAAVYQLAPDYFKKSAADLLFVSSNGWDICGAAWFGFKTFWVNRAGQPAEELGVVPTFEGRDLNDIFKALI